MIPLQISVSLKMLLIPAYMKDMGEASYVLGLEIFRDRTQRILGLSQKIYINKVLRRFNMDSCSASPVSLRKGDKLVLKNVR